MQCDHCKRLDLAVLFATENPFELYMSFRGHTDYQWHDLADVLFFAWHENFGEVKASAEGDCEMCNFVFEIVVRSMPDVETLASELSVVMYAGNGATVKVALGDPYDGLVTLCTLDVSAERTTQFLELHIS
jgi:hypothetical protein